MEDRLEKPSLWEGLSWMDPGEKGQDGGPSSQDGHPPATCTSQASRAAWDPYLQDGAPLRLALHILTGLEHAQGDAVQEDDQHADVLEPGERRALRRAHASAAIGRGEAEVPRYLHVKKPSLLMQAQKKTPLIIPDLLRFEVFGN